MDGDHITTFKEKYTQIQLDDIKYNIPKLIPKVKEIVLEVDQKSFLECSVDVEIEKRENELDLNFDVYLVLDNQKEEYENRNFNYSSDRH